jgi:3-oxoacyl-[acyl-carrier-protein] synthase III
VANNGGSRRNQRLYREVNQHIREVTESFGTDGPAEFLCECGRDDCTATVEFTRVQYDSLLGDGGGAVLLAAEHARGLNGNRVLAENGRFVIVAAD